MLTDSELAFLSKITAEETAPADEREPTAAEMLGYTPSGDDIYISPEYAKSYRRQVEDLDEDIPF